MSDNYVSYTGEDVFSASEKESKFFVNDKLPLFMPHDGDNIIRIVPAQAGDKFAKSLRGTPFFGSYVLFHNAVGSMTSANLCVNWLYKKPCPMCTRANEHNVLNDKAGWTVYGQKKRVLFFVLDLTPNQPKKNEGVCIWACPVTLADAIIGLCKNVRTGEFIDIAHPEKGFSIYFNKTGKNRDTKYTNAQRLDPVPLEGITAPCTFEECLILPDPEEMAQVELPPMGKMPEPETANNAMNAPATASAAESLANLRGRLG